MTDMQQVEYSERPSIAAGLLVQAATRRQIVAALSAIPSHEFAEVITDHLQRRGGRQLVERVAEDLARGLVFK